MSDAVDRICSLSCTPSQLHASSEHRLSRSGHVHMIVRFPPLYLQRPTRQIHPADDNFSSNSLQESLSKPK